MPVQIANLIYTRSGSYMKRIFYFIHEKDLKIIIFTDISFNRTS